MLKLQPVEPSLSNGESPVIKTQLCPHLSLSGFR